MNDLCINVENTYIKDGFQQRLLKVNYENGSWDTTQTNALNKKCIGFLCKTKFEQYLQILWGG